jgi:hypothetical protein
VESEKKDAINGSENGRGMKAWGIVAWAFSIQRSATSAFGIGNRYGTEGVSNRQSAILHSVWAFSIMAEYG